MQTVRRAGHLHDLGKVGISAGIWGKEGPLTEREWEKVRLLARGHTMNQTADELTISYKTVDRHIQNIYAKIKVSTRAGATLFAMENNLLT